MFKSKKTDYELLPTSSAESSPPSTSNSLPSTNHPSQSHKKSRRFAFPPRKYILILILIVTAIWIFIHSFNPFKSSHSDPDSSLIASISPFKGDQNLPPPLSRQAKFDKTLGEAACRNEFPAFYPQLELNKQIWRSKGGIGRAEVERAEREADKGWGYARVSI